jgi:hypothetical protein
LLCTGSLETELIGQNADLVFTARDDNEREIRSTSFQVECTTSTRSKELLRKLGQCARYQGLGLPVYLAIRDRSLESKIDHILDETGIGLMVLSNEGTFEIERSPVARVRTDFTNEKRDIRLRQFPCECIDLSPFTFSIRRNLKEDYLVQ